MNKIHLNGIMKEIVTHEGEGLIVQQSGSQYENGKSISLSKMKVMKFLLFSFNINLILPR
jgi:hypothetical protein